MRRFLLGLVVAVLSVLAAATATGCGDELLATNARSSLSGFLTSMVSGAINTSAN